MTVGVGAICESGNCLVLGCDTRGSYDPSYHLGPNDWTGKAFDLPHGFFALVAGTLNVCHALSGQLTIEMSKLGESFYPENVRLAINDARFYEIREKAGEIMHATLGLSLRAWHRLPRNAQVFDAGKRILEAQPLDAELIVAGFSKRPLEALPMPHLTSICLFRTIGKHHAEIENNFTVIGTGREAARKLLDKRGQNPHRSWQRTAIDVIEAMHSARRANKRNVGNPDDLFIVRESECGRFPCGHTYVMNFRAAVVRDKPREKWDLGSKDKDIFESLILRGGCSSSAP